MKILPFFVSFLFIIGQYEILGDLHFFKPMSDQCNRTYPVTQDTIFADNITQLSEKLKGDRNAKCFIHCFFKELNFVDEKGYVNKKELFQTANNVWSQIPEERKDALAIPIMSPKMMGMVISFIDYCENKDVVLQETDPCNKLYKFSLCLLDDVPASSV